MPAARPRQRHEITGIRVMAGVRLAAPSAIPSTYVVETLACGHEIAFDVVAGWYRVATWRMCKACAGQPLTAPLDIRRMEPPGR